MQLGLVAREDLPAIWPLARFMILRGINHSGLTDFASIEADVLAGRAWLWIAYDLEKIHAAAVTEVSRFGVMTIVSCGGKNLKKFLPLLKQIEFHAKQIGCVAMLIIGRKGWTRLLPDYETKAYVIGKPI